jgi:uncharacterized membrane protein
MKKIISEISKKEISSNEKISISSIRNSILTEIQKDYPQLNTEGYIHIDELELYRQRYIQSVLENNLGELSKVDKKVHSFLKSQDFISPKLLTEKTDDISFGQKLADKVASFGGSWTFIIIFGVFIFIWMILNVVFLASKAYDPYPFILLNLILSCIAALQAPVIMMSQNRQEEKDRERAQNDYMINLKSEMEVRMLHEKIDHLIINQQNKLLEIQQIQIDMLNDISEKIKKN